MTKCRRAKACGTAAPSSTTVRVATLEDRFDPRRLEDDYVPTGFRGAGVKTRAVKGHAFGLDLSPADCAVLVALLKTR